MIKHSERRWQGWQRLQDHLRKYLNPVRLLLPKQERQQLIALAIDVAEEQMRNGTASSQVISHFLKLGSTRAQIEKELLEKQRDLAAAKAEAIESSAKMEDLYLKAAKAMKSYQGQEDEEDEY